MLSFWSKNQPYGLPPFPSVLAIDDSAILGDIQVVFSTKPRLALRLCVGLSLSLAGWLHAQSVTLSPIADTTLFQTDPNNNLGAEPTLVSGTTAAGMANRAILKFDVAGNIPARAIITNVALTLTVLRTAGLQSNTFSLHPLLRDWGEGSEVSPTSGASGGNIGAAAANGEATWLASFFPDTLWSAPGAGPPMDYQTAESASQGVGDMGAYVFSSSNLVADARNWLTNAAANFGWILICADELAAQTSRRFGSREDPVNTPTLLIQYSLAPRPQIALTPVADTTLFEVNPDNNLGASSLVAGTLRIGTRARALLQFGFDTLPPGAIVTSAMLNLTVVTVPPLPVDSSFDLHRVLQPWGEGSKSGLRGTPADPGEATWNARFFPSDLWGTPGAAAPDDFSFVVSTTTPVSRHGAYSFSNLVSDVQFWVDQPGRNFGWILLSQTEETPYTARRFGSREDPVNTPILQLEYVVPPAMVQTEVAESQFNLSFLAQTNQAYVVQFRDSLAGGDWTTWTNIPSPATAQTVVVSDPAVGPQRFYRVGVQ